MDFRLNFTPLIEFGVGKINKVGGILRSDNRKKVMIITGEHSSKAGNALERVLQSLQENGIDYVVSNRPSTEPDTEIIDVLRQQATKEKVDAVVGLGGGSQMDSAKAVAGLLGQTQSTLEYLRGSDFDYHGVPFYAIPTTSGTASEVTMNAVLLDTEKQNKYSISSDQFQARAAIVDPRLTYELDLPMIASTSMDSFTHAIESYVSLVSNEFTKFLAEEAILLILKHLNEGMKKNPVALEHLSKASIFGGIAFAQTGAGLCRAISRPLGARYKIPHGIASAILIPHIINFNTRSSSQEYHIIEQRLETEVSLGEYIQYVIDELPIDNYLRDYGFKMEDAKEIARLSMEGNAFTRNPRVATEKDIIEILRQCY